MNILIINGPNINLLGQRETEIYGKESYKDLVKKINKYAKNMNIKTKIYQTNHEGKIIDFLQKNHHKYQGLIINPGAYTHYSYAIRDCLAGIKEKKVEVHLSDINKREDFRKISVIGDVVDLSIIGKGFDGYIQAIDYIIKDEKL